MVGACVRERASERMMATLRRGRWSMVDGRHSLTDPTPMATSQGTPTGPPVGSDGSGASMVCGTTDALALYGLGMVFANGWGVEKHDAKALEYFAHAAAMGLSRAQYSLAVMYEHGRGCEPDGKLALQWYQAAALDHHPKAMYNLGTRAIERASEVASRSNAECVGARARMAWQASCISRVARFSRARARPPSCSCNRPSSGSPRRRSRWPSCTRAARASSSMRRPPSRGIRRPPTRAALMANTASVGVVGAPPRVCRVVVA